jgi:hypothetical protein
MWGAMRGSFDATLNVGLVTPTPNFLSRDFIHHDHHVCQQSIRHILAAPNISFEVRMARNVTLGIGHPLVARLHLREDVA